MVGEEHPRRTADHGSADVRVVVVLGLLSRRPAPFVVSFTSAFIVFYGCEAFLLRQMLERSARSSQGAVHE